MQSAAVPGPLPAVTRRWMEKMVPIDMHTSMFELPSSGSNMSTYLPLGNSGGIGMMSSFSSDAITQTWPPASTQRTRIWLASTSSFCTTSPWTFLPTLARPSTSLRPALCTREAIMRPASAMDWNSPVKSPVAPGVLRWRSRMCRSRVQPS